MCLPFCLSVLTIRSVILFQLSQAGLRELEEETGLHLTTDMCENGRVTPLALWEVREHNVRQA